jgi:hypothetical protein
MRVVLLLACLACSSPSGPYTIGELCEINADEGCSRAVTCSVIGLGEKQDCRVAALASCCRNAPCPDNAWSATEDELVSCVAAWETHDCTRLLSLPDACHDLERP